MKTHLIKIVIFLFLTSTVKGEILLPFLKSKSPNIQKTTYKSISTMSNNLTNEQIIIFINSLKEHKTLRSLLHVINENINNIRKAYTESSTGDSLDQSLIHLQNHISFLVKKEIKAYKFLYALVNNEYTKSKSSLVETIILLQNLYSEAPEELQPILKSGLDHLNVLADKTSPLSKSYTATISDNLDPQETNFLKHRISMVKTHLENKFGTMLSMDETPRIALCASGGGYRSLIGNRGFFEGAEQTGLLDAVTYISCLSGGTWATFPWLMRQAKSSRSSFDATDAVHNLQDVMFSPKNPFLMHNTFKNRKQTIEMTNNFLVKLIKRERITFVDIYAALLGNSLLRTLFDDINYDEYYTLKLHELAPFMSQPKPSPLPIGTAIVSNHKAHSWIEVTPFACGGLKLGPNNKGAFVPTESFGSKFFNTRCIETVPPQFLGYYLGMFGSDFAENSTDLLKKSGLEKKLISTPVLGDILLQTTLSPFDIYFKQAFSNESKRSHLSAQLNNFTLGINGAPFAQETHLNCIDAGLDFNLPLPPLVERKERNLDLIIIIDMSKGLDKEYDGIFVRQLQRAIHYFEKNNIPFPITLDKMKKLGKDLIDNPFTIFKDEALSPITVVYIPWCYQLDKATSWCGTHKFTYSPHQITRLAECMTQRAKVADNAIMEEVQNIIKKKKSSKL